MKNYAESVKGRLKRIFRETKEPFDKLLLQYTMERCLYRLANSELKSQFILKGGILFYVWTKKKFRPTKDLDFSFYGEFNPEEIFSEIQKALSLSIPEDALSFEDFKMKPIKEDHEYEGIRITFKGKIDRTWIPMQLDISTGDKITPGTSLIEFPQLLDMDAPTINTYPKETVFAEKVEAMVKLDIGTSRMKDVYDLYIIITMFGEQLDKKILLKAIQTTFSHRKTPVPEVPVKVFSNHFFDNADKQKEWQAFITESTEPELRLEDAINTIANFLNPLLLMK